ncbi:MAG TPA: hypothetical protein VFS81_23895, partial [Candidatus Binatia bacterium]|nr:hypothetical protein [Candidatus Binatia bacterium]
MSCYRPKTPADQEWALATIQKLITAGLSFPSGVSHDPSTIEWESMLLDGSDLGTIITREAAARRLQEAVPAQIHLWSNVKHAVQYG